MQDIENIYEDKKKSVNEKAKDLKQKLEFYVTCINSYISEIEKAQKNFIKDVSHTFGNVAEAATFLFYNVGKLLLLLLSWKKKNRNQFSIYFRCIHSFIKTMWEAHKLRKFLNPGNKCVIKKKRIFALRALLECVSLDI